MPAWSGETWLAAGFLGVFSTAVAYVLFLWAVKRFGASLAAMVTYLTPIATLLLAFIMLGDLCGCKQKRGGPRAQGTTARRPLTSRADQTSDAS